MYFIKESKFFLKYSFSQCKENRAIVVGRAALHLSGTESSCLLSPVTLTVLLRPAEVSPMTTEVTNLLGSADAELPEP